MKIMTLLADITLEARGECELRDIRPRSASFEVAHGDIFVAVCGGRYDGHDFISEAIRRGTVLVVAERLTPALEESSADFIIVNDSKIALARLWNASCGFPSRRMSFIAVTGTNGKTSTAQLLAHILRRAGYEAATLGTLSSGFGGMTTPPPELLYPELNRLADAGVELVVCEASSHALTQRRLDAIRFELAIFTNLTPEHLDYHRDMESYLAAKARLLKLSRTALINVGDPYMATLAALDTPHVTYSARGDADFTACEVCGAEYVLKSSRADFRVRCEVGGKFALENSLAAASAALLLAVKPEVIARALADCPQVRGRLERLEVGREFDVYIDYAHTPDALKKALEALRSDCRGELYVLFGCGGDRDRSKRPVMGRIASELADRVILTSDNSRSELPEAIIADILAGIPDVSCVTVEVDRELAIRSALRALRPGDVLLLAGKGHEEYVIDRSGRRYFSEKRIVEDELNK